MVKEEIDEIYGVIRRAELRFDKMKKGYIAGIVATFLLFTVPFCIGIAYNNIDNSEKYYLQRCALVCGDTDSLIVDNDCFCRHKTIKCKSGFASIDEFGNADCLKFKIGVLTEDNG